MDAKVKRGIGYIVTGVLYAGIGVMTIVMPDVPAVAYQVAQAVVLVGGIFGVQAVFPE